MEEVGKRWDKWCREKYLYVERIVVEIQGSWVPC